MCPGGGKPAVVLTGPRQVGKTTLAHRIASERGAVYLDLERPRDLARIADVEQYCEIHADKLLVLDEVHRSPGLFAPLRGIIDRRRRSGRRTGQFLFLGSASIDLMKQSGETLAGRVAYCESWARCRDAHRGAVTGRRAARKSTWSSTWARERSGRWRSSEARRHRFPGASTAPAKT